VTVIELAPAVPCAESVVLFGAVAAGASVKTW
jgi:hypothetical protein